MTKCAAAGADAPVPMLLWCPSCGERHIDEGVFAMKPHHTHACQHCGMTWRPAVVPTCGVAFLPGFKNESGADEARPPESSALTDDQREAALGGWRR